MIEAERQLNQIVNMLIPKQL